MFLVTVLVLGRYLACSVLVVAYIFSLARPWPGINRNRSLFFPRFRSRVSAPVSPQVHVCYELATVPLEPRGPNTDCIATPRLASSLSLSHTHTHTHTLSLSLSLSLWQWDNNHAHRPSSCTACILTLGRRSEIDLITLSNSRADSNSAIQLAAPVRQWAFSSSLSHFSFYFSNSSLPLATPFISSAIGLPRAF